MSLEKRRRHRGANASFFKDSTHITITPAFILPRANASVSTMSSSSLSPARHENLYEVSVDLTSGKARGKRKFDHESEPAQTHTTVAQKESVIRLEDKQEVAESKVDAISKFWKEAVQGNADAQYELGNYYLYNDKFEAVSWYQRAAIQGHAIAQNDLATCYAMGHGMTQDLAKAAKWYGKAAELGDAMAEYNLAMCYLYGYGVIKDKEKAATWFQKAAEHGYVRAQEYLTQPSKEIAACGMLAPFQVVEMKEGHPKSIFFPPEFESDPEEEEQPNVFLQPGMF